MKKFMLVAAAISALTTSAYGSTTDAGERISKRGEQIHDYGKSWTDGKQDVARGQKRLDKGTSDLADAEKALERARGKVGKAERQISDARSDKADGERLIVEGTSQMQRAEAAYLAVRAGPSAVTP